MLLKLEVIGQYEGGQAWGKHDYAIATSPKGREKIFRKFSRIKHDFAFYLHFSPPRNLVETYREYPRAFIEWARPDDRLDDRINVLMLNNIGPQHNHRMINAWTLVHRFVHCVQTIQMFDENFFWQRLTKIASMMSNYEYKELPERMGIFHVGETCVSLTQAILTMRCARERKISNSFDVSAEMMSQYLLTGRVTFNSADEVVRQASEFWVQKHIPMYFGHKLVMREDIDLDALQSILDELRLMVEEKFEELLERMKGRVVAF